LWLDTSPGVAGSFSRDGVRSGCLSGFVSSGDGSLEVVEFGVIGLIRNSGGVSSSIGSNISGDVLSGVSRNVGSSIGGEIGSGVSGDVLLGESGFIEVDTGIVEDNLVIEMSPDLVSGVWGTIMIIRSVKSKGLD